MKGKNSMAHMTSQTGYTEERTHEMANASPLGFIALAFTTALIGCSFAHLFVPGPGVGIGIVVGPALLFGGVVQFLAGMWEFRRGNNVVATVFAAYGGFLAALGLFFLPTVGLLSYFSLDTAALNHGLGMLFLCWTICIGVLLICALRANLLMMGVLGLLALAYLFLMIGEFAGGNMPLLVVGGAFAIICALVAWYAALASLLAASRSTIRVPMEQMA